MREAISAWAMPVRERSMHCGENFGAVAAFDGFEERGAAGVFGGGAASLRIEDCAAADCGDWRKLANDEAVAGEEQDFFA